METRKAFEMSEEQAMAGATAGARRTDERTGAARRRVEATSDRLEHVVLYEEVPAGEAVLALGRRLPQSPERGDVRTYEATLRFPGRFGPRQAVELDVIRHDDLHASFVLRRVDTSLRRLSPERYARAAVAALSALDHLLPWQAAVGTSLSLELARELLEQSGAVVPAPGDALDRALEALFAGTAGHQPEAERVA